VTEKLLHVSLLVKENHVWDLLRTFDEHKVGNVEVTAVVPPPLALPAPERERQRAKSNGRVPAGQNKQAVLAATKPGETFSARDVSAKAGITTKQASSALYNLMLNGMVRRAGFGKFRLTAAGTK
jgi:hypothetical protein